MGRFAPAALIALYFACTASTPTRANQVAPADTGARSCSPAGTAYTRTTLYFGLTRPTGVVSENQWKTFLRDKVTPRFPDGLTVWEADGQWRRADGRITRERSKVLLLVHDDTPSMRASISGIVSDYKRDFQQESVLWETASVCAAF
jgi:hypothetical protein